MLDALVFQAGYTASVVSLGVIGLGCAGGILGTFILLRGRALAADAVAHASLPGFAIAFLVAALLGMQGKSLLVLGTGAVVATVIALATLQRLEATPHLRPDAAIGVVLAASYALGIVVLSIVQTLPVGGQAGLTSYLLGSTAGMLAREAWTNLGVASAIAVVVLVLYKEFAALTFDIRHARLIGLPVALLDGLLLAMLLVLAIAALQSVGAILFVALIVIPAAAARLWVTRLSSMVLLAAVIGAVGCHVGVALSATVARLPTGPAIVLTLATIFALSLLLAPRRGLIARMGAARRSAAGLRAALAAGQRTRP